ARSGWPNGVGLAADPELTTSSLGERSAAAPPHVAQDALGPIALDKPWGEGVVDQVRHGLDRLHRAVPEHDLQEDAFPSLGLEIHVEDEIAERVHHDSRSSHLHALDPMRMPTDHQISAGIGECPCSDALAGFGTVRVLGTPVCRYHGDIDPLAERSNVGADSLELRAVQGAGTRWHIEPIGAGPGGGGGRWLPHV